MIYWWQDHAVAGVVTGIYLLLVVATLLCGALLRSRPSPETTNNWRRIRTWWILVTLVVVACTGGTLLIAGLFCAASLLALYELVQLELGPGSPCGWRTWAGLALPAMLMYVVLLLQGAAMWWLPALPLGAMMVAWLVAKGNCEGRVTLQLSWPCLLVVSGPGCMVLLGQAAEDGFSNSATGVVLFLLLLTALNDVGQYIFGKLLGGRKVAPRISPSKTWAGFAGGVGTTTVLAVALASPLTWLSSGEGAYAGVGIAVFGFAGDLAFSAYKRRVGAKDSGTLLPGHGGLVDRIDSLCLTAPFLTALLVWWKA